MVWGKLLGGISQKANRLSKSPNYDSRKELSKNKEEKTTAGGASALENG